MGRSGGMLITAPPDWVLDRGRSSLLLTYRPAVVPVVEGWTLGGWAGGDTGPDSQDQHLINDLNGWQGMKSRISF
jgi:hypothetical protein